MEKKDLKKYAYDVIKHNILQCKYAPGSFINEQMLVDELAISRTPIREALNRIERDGLVTILPKKGIYVTEITVSGLSQMYQARILLEPFVVRASAPYLEKARLQEILQLCYEQKDDESGLLLPETDAILHGYLVDNCKNVYIVEIMHRILEHNKRVHLSAGKGIRIDNAREEHIGILLDLLDGRIDEATKKMCAHLENCRDCAFTYFRTWGGP